MFAIIALTEFRRDGDKGIVECAPDIQRLTGQARALPGALS
jgi:hypothetical protein